MRNRRSSGIVSERFNVWPGFTDVMVGLLLVFIFVVTLFTITETLLSRTLSKKDTELERLGKELSAQQTEQERLALALHKLEELFVVQEKTAEDLRRLLAARTREFEAALAEIAGKTSQLKQKDDLIAAGKTELTGLQALLAERLAALTDMARLLAERDQALQETDKIAETRRLSIEEALERIASMTAVLGEKDKRIESMGLQLRDAEKDLTTAKAEVIRKARTLEELTAQTVALNARIAALNDTIAGYLAELERVNRLLGESKESESTEKLRVASLQQDIVTLQEKLHELGRKLSDTEIEREKEKQFRMAQLVDLLSRKDREIRELRELARYRSEFLARLEEVFHGVADIKVQGDRFVFQAEVLFAPGKSDINETGKRELDKFIATYKEMEPKIPRDVDLIILVQGHTDVDPVHTSRYRSNWELSSARAMEVVRHLIANGIPATRLGASALGEFHPAASGTSKESKRLNRRIEIKITSL